MTKVAIITGAGQGIGKACAEKLAENGVNVVIADMNIETAQATANEIAETYGVGTLAVKVNVADEQQIQDMVKATVDKFGTVDILINNAGICPLKKPFEEVTTEEWHRTIEVNLMGTVNCTKAVIPMMKEKKYGRIVCTASMAGQLGGLAVSPTYAVTKAAIICMVKSVAKYLGPFGDITCNAVAPGIIDTAMQATMKNDVSAIPLQRMGTPKEVANTIYFLASEEASYITGMTVDINGGMYLR